MLRGEETWAYGLQSRRVLGQNHCMNEVEGQEVTIREKLLIAEFQK